MPVFNDPVEAISWFNRGDGLPVYWDQFRDQARAGLKEWYLRNEGERRIAEAVKAMLS